MNTFVRSKVSFVKKTPNHAFSVVRRVLLNHSLVHLPVHIQSNIAIAPLVFMLCQLAALIC